MSYYYLLLPPKLLSASPSTPSHTSLCFSFYSFPYFSLPLLLLLPPILLSASPSTPSPYTSLCLSFYSFPYLSLPLLLLLPLTSLCLSFYSFPYFSLPLLLLLPFFSLPLLLLLPLLLSASPSTPSPISLCHSYLLLPPSTATSCVLPSPKAPFSPLLYPFLTAPSPPFIPWT
jgi:hypothetical protein